MLLPSRTSRLAFFAAATAAVAHGAEVDDIVQNDDCYMKLERDGASCHAGLADSITSQFGGGAMVRANGDLPMTVLCSAPLS